MAVPAERTVEVLTPAGTLRALVWAAPVTPPDAPMALCLHGFPDTADGWRMLAPHLVAAGYRVVAPFMRGYGPSDLAGDGSYHIGALMDDALRVRTALGASGEDLLVGHDWGAIAAAGLVALPESVYRGRSLAPFADAVIMSVPPPAVFRRRVARPARLAAVGASQLVRSWYIWFFQLPALPERSARWVVPLLWRRWSPHYLALQDVGLVRDAIGSSPQRWSAALATYRTVVRNTAPPPQYADLHRYWLAPPAMPVLYLHGADDGCMSATFTDWVRPALPDGSRAEVVAGAGHFLALERPAQVVELIAEYLADRR